MSDDLIRQVEELRERLNKLLRQRAALHQKSKQLGERVQDARHRERAQEDLTRELVERQRELNFMLNRANIMLSRVQEANMMLSVEFTEMIKALPEPKAKDVRERIDRMNELFKKTGTASESREEENLGSPEPQTPPPPPQFREAEIVEMAQRPQAKTAKSEAQIPSAKPPDEQSDNEPVMEEEPQTAVVGSAQTEDQSSTLSQEVTASPEPEPETAQEEPSEEDLAFPPRKRPWWRFGT